MAEPPSSPPSADATAEDALAWYKSQYEQLELEMQEFQESSKLLESELENELSAADKREREHKEKVEMLGYQVDEWKVSLLGGFGALPRPFLTLLHLQIGGVEAALNILG